MVFEEAVVTHGIEATCASPNGIEAKCASPRWRPNPEIDWHRDRYPRDMINPAGRNHVNRQRSPSSNAINFSSLGFHIHAVFQFYPWFNFDFSFFFSVVIYDNEYQTKENQN